MKTNIELVKFVIKALTEKWGYVWGTWGLILNDVVLQFKVSQYPLILTPDRVSYIKKHYMGRRTADCGGLIKAFLWWNISNPRYDPANDVSVDTMYEQATVKGNIASLPEIPGILVRYKGHVGVYIGNGEVIEARGTVYGVVKTELGKRPWSHWFNHKDIHYITENESKGIYTDVAADRWSYADIVQASILGLIGGYPDGKFKPTEPVTREHVAVIAMRIYNKLREGG